MAGIALVKGPGYFLWKISGYAWTVCGSYFPTTGLRTKGARACPSSSLLWGKEGDRWPFPVTSAEDVGAQILCKPEHLLMRLKRLHMPTFGLGVKNKGWTLLACKMTCHVNYQLQKTPSRRHKSGPESLKEIFHSSANPSPDSKEYPISSGLFLPFLPSSNT